VGFAKSGAGEYTISIFQVVTIALLVSWIVAVVFTPWLGYKLLDPAKLRAIAEKHGGDIYDSPFYRRFRALVVWCLRHRWLVIGATIGVFGCRWWPSTRACRSSSSPPPAGPRS
jgi:multidrug efflux pump